MSRQKITVWLIHRADRPHFHLEWKLPGSTRRRSKTTRTADEDQAEQQRRDLEYELNHGMHRDRSKMTWPQFRLVYERDQLAGRRKNTRKKAGSVFDSFAAQVKPERLCDVDEEMLTAYTTKLRTLGRKPATIAGNLAYLRAALRWAALQKLIPVAPHVVMPKVPKKSIVRKIVAEEFERLILKAPDRHWRLLMNVAWYTGMRRCEMLDLTWDDESTPRVDLAAKRIWIPAAYNKSDADQWLPLHSELEKIIRAEQPHQRGHLFPFHAVPAEVSRRFSALAKAAGLRITLHDLRRSFGTRYAGIVPAQVLKRLMRHADIKTTLEYYVVLDDVLQDAINKV